MENEQTSSKKEEEPTHFSCRGVETWFAATSITVMFFCANIFFLKNYYRMLSELLILRILAQRHKNLCPVGILILLVLI